MISDLFFKRRISVYHIIFRIICLSISSSLSLYTLLELKLNVNTKTLYEIKVMFANRQVAYGYIFYILNVTKKFQQPNKFNHSPWGTNDHIEVHYVICNLNQR